MATSLGLISPFFVKCQNFAFEWLAKHILKQYIHDWNYLQNPQNSQYLKQKLQLQSKILDPLSYEMISIKEPRGIEILQQYIQTYNMTKGDANNQLPTMNIGLFDDESSSEEET